MINPIQTLTSTTQTPTATTAPRSQLDLYVIYPMDIIHGIITH